MADICFITGAGEHFKDDIFTPDEKDLVIAADGGYDFLMENNIRTDVIIGDFDSTDKTKNINIKTIKLNPIKDETDMLCAINYGTEHNYKTFYIFGGTGGRTDHTIANIQCLSALAARGMKGYLFSENEVMTVIHNDSIHFTEKATGYISVFSLDNESKGVTETGLKYQIENYTMKNDFPIGVSNEFIGKESSISVDNGSLLIIFKKNIITKQIGE